MKYLQTDDRDDYFASITAKRTYPFVSIKYANGNISNWISKQQFRIKMKKELGLTKSQFKDILTEKLIEIHKERGNQVIIKRFDTCSDIPKITIEDFKL